MSWQLWAQVMLLILWVSLNARHVLEAKRQSVNVAINQTAPPAEIPAGPKLAGMTDRGH